MSTVIRAELSKKNQYYLERHRYYELKHYCLQYPIWKRAYVSLDGLSKRPNDLAAVPTKSGKESPVERCAIAMASYNAKIKMLERIARDVDDTLSDYILRGVTEGLSYDLLRTRYGIPCCKDVYYELYRKFFWMLNKERD